MLRRDRHDRVCVMWERAASTGLEDSEAAGAASSATSTSGGSGGSSRDGKEEEGTWVSERHACMVHVPAAANELRRGSRAVAVWLDGHAYACEVLGSAGRRQMAVQFEDGLQYDAPLDKMRTLLDEPLYAAPPRAPPPRRAPPARCLPRRHPHRAAVLVSLVPALIMSAPSNRCTGEPVSLITRRAKGRPPGRSER